MFAAACAVRPRLSAPYLARFRDRRLAVVLQEAARVAHYRDLWKGAGVRGTDVCGVADLGMLPITTKAMLRTRARDALLARPASAGALLHHATSGSTGIPTHVWRSPAEERRLNLVRWRTLLGLGLRPGDRLAVVKLTTGAMPARFDRLQKAVRRLGLVDRQVFDCFLPAERLLGELAAFQPAVLSGYARTLVRVARVLEGRSLPWKPRLVVTGGEGITPAERALLQARFNAPVRDIYGTTECNVMAFECAATQAYHVCDDSVILEVCRDGVPVASGEVGDVVVTSLHSLAMPLVRVEVGDRAVAGSAQCACGSPFSTLARIEGRVVDPFVLSGGQTVHPFVLTNQVMETAGGWVQEFQIDQVRCDAFVVTVVGKGDDVAADDLARLHAALAAALPGHATIAVTPVAAIAQDPSGKLHYCRASCTVPAAERHA